MWGWQKCCHGLSCRPLEASGEEVLSDLLSLLGYPGGSGAALLSGSLRLKYQTLPFARKKPMWKIPLLGGGGQYYCCKVVIISAMRGLFSFRRLFPW